MLKNPPLYYSFSLTNQNGKRVSVMKKIAIPSLIQLPSSYLTPFQMRLAVGSILESVGFTHAAASALELITDIGVRYMRKLATTAARSAEMGTVGREGL